MKLTVRLATLIAVLMMFPLSRPMLAANIVPKGVTAGTGGLTTKGGQLAVKTVGGSDLFTVTKGTGATTIASTLTVTGAATLQYLPIVTETTTSRTVTSSDFGKVIVCTAAGGATTVTLPNPGASIVGATLHIAQTANQDLIIVGGSTANNNKIVADGVATSDQVSFATASHKIGAMARVTCISATQWLITNASSCAMTVEAAD